MNKRMKRRNGAGNLPRGIRNNNPGNIRKSSDNWFGLSPFQTDVAFHVFEEPVWGLRALMKILVTYYRRYQLDTVRSIVNRWAPPHENDTGSYALHVSKILGVKMDAPINVDRLDTLIKLAKGITLHENGKPERFADISTPFWYPEQIYQEAAYLALNLKYNTTKETENEIV